MPATESTLNKIKLLLKLANSPNPNEAANARAMADKFISKYEITPEELKSLEDKKPLYGEEEKLFTTLGIESWRQQLALAVGKYFECQIVQEELVPAEGLRQYNYYVYGDPQDVETVKFVYPAFSKKVEEIVLANCVGRGPIYVGSYCEGVVEAIKNNIYWGGIEVPAVKSPAREIEEVPEKVLNNGEANLAPVKEEKEPAADQTIDVNSQSFIKDVMAYFKGLDDGKQLALSDILELESENEGAAQLESGE